MGKDSAVMTFNFELDGVSNEVIDLSQCASILNRRFYRQGLNWAVVGFRFGWNGEGSQGFEVGVYHAPQSWVVSGAWLKGMKKWQKQQNEALLESGSMSQKARFQDFKVYLDELHAVAGFTDNLTPVSPGGIITHAIPSNNVPLPKGEWQYSQVLRPTLGGAAGAAENYIKLLGEDSAFLSLVDGYQKSRSVPHSPDPDVPTLAADSWLNEMFDDGNTNYPVVDNAVDKNNDLPYDQDDYPYSGTLSLGAAQLHRQTAFTPTTVSRFNNLEGGLFPCGLIAIRYVNMESPADPNFRLSLQVMMVPGPNRGYLTQTMGDMN